MRFDLQHILNNCTTNLAIDDILNAQIIISITKSRNKIV